MTFVEIQDALYDWVFSVIGQTVGENIVWRNQKAQLPPRPVATLKVISGPDRVGSFDDVLYSGNDATGFNVGGHRTYSIGVQIFGSQDVRDGTAYQLASDLHASLTRPTILQTLCAAGIAIHEKGTVTDISAVEEDGFENRAQMDILIGVASNVEDQPGFIETVDTIQGSYN